MPKKSTIAAPFVYEVEINPANGTVKRDIHGNPMYRVKNTMTHLTPGVISTGDLATLQSFRAEHEDELTQQEKAYLDVRIHTAQRVQELEEQAKKNIYEGKETPRPTVHVDEQGFYGFSDVKLDGPQTSNNGCWSTSLALMLGTRGVDLSQEEIRSFRPEYPEGVMPDADVTITANRDGPNNPYANADLLLKVLPNSSMQQLQFNPIRTSEIRANGQPLTKDEAEVVDVYFRDEMKRKLQEAFTKALVEDRSPVGLCLDGHFVTVTGIKDDGTIRFEDSARGNPNEPYRSTKTMTMDELVDNYLFDHYTKDGNFKQAGGLSLCWMKDLDTPEHELRQEEKPRVYPTDETIVAVDENGSVKVDVPPDHASITTSGKASEGFVKGQGVSQTLKLDQTLLSEMLDGKRIENTGPGEYFFGSQDTYLPKKVYYLKDPALKPQEIRQELQEEEIVREQEIVAEERNRQESSVTKPEKSLEEEQEERLDFKKAFIDLWGEARNPEASPEERQNALASLIALNGMWVEAQENGTENQGADENKLEKQAAEIKGTFAFQQLMKDGHDKELCEKRDINQVITELQAKDREIAAYRRIAIQRKDGKNFVRKKTFDAASSMITGMADIGGTTGAGKYWGGVIRRGEDENSPEYNAMMAAVGNYKIDATPENLYLSVQATLKYLDGKENVRWSGTGQDRWAESMRYLAQVMPTSEFEKVCQRVNEKRGAGINSSDRIGPEDFTSNGVTVRSVLADIKYRIDRGIATDRDYARIIAIHERHGDALEEDEDEFLDELACDENRHSMTGLRRTVDQIMADQDFLWLMAHKPKRELAEMARDNYGAGLADYKSMVADMKAEKSIAESEVIDKPEVQPPKPKKKRSDMVPFRQQKAEPEKRVNDKALEYLNKNQIESGYLFLDKLGINILHAGEKPDVNNGVPQVFVVKDGKVSTLEENGIEAGSKDFWEMANMGQIFAYPAGEQDPVQIQLIWVGNGPSVEISDPLNLKEGFPVEKPKPPEKPREPRWYHRWFPFGNNRVIRDRYDRYVNDYEAWKSNADAEEAKAKSVAQTIQKAYGDNRLLFSNSPELIKAQEARQNFAETRALMDAEAEAESVGNKIGVTEKVVKDALSIYQPKPEIRDEWLKKDPNDPEDEHKGNIYEKKQFDKLTTIQLTDDLKIGPQKVSDREFGALAMFASKEPDIGMATQTVNGDPQPVVNALMEEHFTEAEARDMVTDNSSELTTRSIMLNPPRGDTGNYIATSIQPARERALQALQEHRDGNSTKLVGILARMVGAVGRMNMSNSKFSENLLGQNKLAAELLDMIHRDPKLEAAVRQEYERAEGEFHKNHPQYVKPLSFDEQVKVIRGVQKMDTIKENCLKAQKKLLDARIKGEELSEAEKKSCARDILKFNLFQHQHSTHWDAINHEKADEELLKPSKHLNNLYAQLSVKHPSQGALSSNGGSSTPTSPASIAYTAMLNRIFPKSEVLDVLSNPRAMAQIDNALDELIVREGMDKITTRQLSDQLVMKEVDGKDVEKKLHDAAKEPEKQNEPQLNISNVEKKGPGVDVGNL